MPETIAGERELADFLDAQQKLELATWQRERSSDELVSLVMRRLDMLDAVDL